jgi:surfactin synthase thioesterase subunit/aryl carrier-like protein
VSAADNLFDAGLDSLTAMEIISELRKNGWDCSFSLIYQNPTVAALAEALSGSGREGGRSKEYREGIEYIKEVSGNTELFLAVPYGGGSSESFAELFPRLEKECEKQDIAVVCPADFGEESAGTIAEKLLPVVKKYEGITLLGYCVGSAIVTAFAFLLQKEKIALRHVYILGSLPEKGIRIRGKALVPWDYMSDKRILQVLGGRQTMPDLSEKLPQFRKDSRRFYEYFGEKERCETVPVDAALTLVFGEKDRFTAGWKRKWRSWKKYFGGNIRVVCLKDAGHYFMKEISEKTFS